MFVIPDTKCVIRDVQLVIPAAWFVIPAAWFVIPAAWFVIPDQIRDPVPRPHWIADQVRNDKHEPQ